MPRFTVTINWTTLPTKPTECPTGYTAKGRANIGMKLDQKRLGIYQVKNSSNQDTYVEGVHDALVRQKPAS